MTENIRFFIPLSKVDKEKRIVSGYASTPTKDMDGEIVTLDAIKKALPGYMNWRNIREMHRLSAVGTTEEAHVDKVGLYISAKIVDDAAWKKCLEGVYKGFSIGGRKLEKVGDEITEIELSEISVVDRPANPDAVFALAKSAKLCDPSTALGFLYPELAKRTPEEKAARALAKAAEALVKRNPANPPAAHDGLSLPAGKESKTPSPKDALVQKEGDSSKGAEPYGDVEYADPGHREDKKKRYPIDTEEHIRAAWNYIHKPKNAKKYSSEDLASVKAKILSAWKKKIDPKGPPSAQNKTSSQKSALSAMDVMTLHKTLELNPSASSFLTLGKKADRTRLPFLELKKGMSTAGSLAYCFDSIRSAQRSLMLEGQREGGDKKDVALAKQLGQVAKTLAEIISNKASHEGAEAEDFSDVDDAYITSILGKDFVMSVQTDNLTKALQALVKGAKAPTKEDCMKSASKNLKKAREARKSAGKAIAEAHEMHKAAYLAKMAKAGKSGKDDNDGDEFDHQGAMEKLQKAYSELEKLGTFAKKASVELKKAAQAGTGPGDGNEHMQVPPGVKNLNISDLAGATPGGGSGGGMPPMYPGDGSVYPGKAAGGADLMKYAKDGMVPLHLVELLQKSAQQEGELEILRRLPSGGRKPVTFDLTKVGGGVYGDPRAGSDDLFKGVDISKLGSDNEADHTAQTAKIIGNLLTSGSHARSIMDPAFKGAAAGRS